MAPIAGKAGHFGAEFLSGSRSSLQSWHLRQIPGSSVVFRSSLSERSWNQARKNQVRKNQVRKNQVRKNQVRKNQVRKNQVRKNPA